MDLGERIKNLNLGERIKKVREEKGIKQKDLADKIGISYVMLSQYERGVRTPKYEMIDKIAKSLDIDPFYLMYGEMTQCFLLLILLKNLIIVQN